MPLTFVHDIVLTAKQISSYDLMTVIVPSKKIILVTNLPAHIYIFFISIAFQNLNSYFIIPLAQG